ncbi:hypothetical protein [Streptomyces sp. NPDC048192]|uniref:hypothetical protein n=1 Tax=Streptomyces sp. NPDC048192 TaxID=3365510 RepID=UPI0037205E8B
MDGGHAAGYAPRTPPNGYPTDTPGPVPPNVYDAEPTQVLPGAGHASVGSGSPNVYLPQASAAPTYDEYADPAAAHGWSSAYEETSELPRLTEPVPPGEGRAARRRAERGTGGRRRVAAVAGALGVAGAVAVIAVMAGGSDSPAPDGSGPARGGRVTVGDSGTPSGSTDAGSPAAAAPTSAAGVPVGPSSSASASSSSSPSSPSSSARGSQSPASGGPTVTTSPPDPATSSAPAPTPTASLTAFPGRGHGRGGKHGQ